MKRRSRNGRIQRHRVYDCVYSSTLPSPCRTMHMPAWCAWACANHKCNCVSERRSSRTRTHRNLLYICINFMHMSIVGICIDDEYAYAQQIDAFEISSLFMIDLMYFCRFLHHCVSLCIYLCLTRSPQSERIRKNEGRKEWEAWTREREKHLSHFHAYDRWTLNTVKLELFHSAIERFDNDIKNIGCLCNADWYKYCSENKLYLWNQRRAKSKH